MQLTPVVMFVIFYILFWLYGSQTLNQVLYPFSYQDYLPNLSRNGGMSFPNNYTDMNDQYLVLVTCTFKNSSGYVLSIFDVDALGQPIFQEVYKPSSSVIYGSTASVKINQNNLVAFYYGVCKYLRSGCDLYVDLVNITTLSVTTINLNANNTSNNHTFSNSTVLLNTYSGTERLFMLLNDEIVFTAVFSNNI